MPPPPRPHDDDEFDDDEDLDEDGRPSTAGPETASEVPDGVAVFPFIPEELGVNPFLLSILHATVFLDGSDAAIVHPAAAAEAMEYVAGYLQRVDSSQFAGLKEDIDCLVGYAKEQKWPKPYIQFLRNFLADNGIEAAES